MLSNPSNQDSSVSPLSRFLATGFFSGYSPIVPGTAGSLVGLLIYAIPGMNRPILLGISILLMFFVGVGTSARMEKQYGEDPSIVVIDEIVGMWISLLFLPRNLWVALLAFVFFRVYDTVKPPPARQWERFRQGWGVMLDDVAAGVYANISVWLILLVFPVR